MSYVHFCGSCCWLKKNLIWSKFSWWCFFFYLTVDHTHLAKCRKFPLLEVEGAEMLDELETSSPPLIRPSSRIPEVRSDMQRTTDLRDVHNSSYTCSSDWFGSGSAAEFCQQLRLTWLPLPLHPLLGVREQPLQSLQDVSQGGAQQWMNHSWQRFGGWGVEAASGWRHLPHGRQEVAAADGDGGDVQQELLGGAVDLRVVAPQSAERRLGAHRPDVSAAVTWDTEREIQEVSKTCRPIKHVNVFCQFLFKNITVL